jgi:hypothetical protein
MFHQFLENVQSGHVQSLLEIAQKMNISQDMVLQIAEDLTNRGYLQEIGGDCNVPQGSCSDCPASSGCQTMTRHWFLTRKGRTAINHSR